MNFSNYKVTDFIVKFEKAIPDTLCDNIILKSQNYLWKRHDWYGLDISKNKFSHFEGDEKEFYKIGLDRVSQMQIYPIIEEYIKKYKLSLKIEAPLSSKSPVQLNKYHTGSRMRKHIDHIHDCFDGERKGIPVISIVGLLNDNFTGGDFVFWDEHKIPLNKGDLLFFPSLFMYSHKVNEIIEGNRYSIVVWCW